MKKIIIAITLIISIFLGSISNVYATEIQEPITTSTTSQIEDIEQEENDHSTEIIYLLMGILVVEIIGLIIK